MNKPNDALQEFNSSRWDAEWGERSLYNMIEIYLNPANEIIGGEVLVQTAADRDEKTDTELLAILNADKLLKVSSVAHLKRIHHVTEGNRECRSWHKTQSRSVRRC